ncbi:MAG: cytochrome C biogenesis protein [Prochlorococcus sp. SP3034]|nr:cytochrome C biogenesis protein [Prochlorococcus sp. SP3034]|tara:strand:+ start:806 stop:1468 length:663 start_codon:yes stop_codon:yes gene_type:complete
MEQGLNHPGPLTVLLIFLAGLLTSLGPCSLSLLPITVAYIGGTDNVNNKFRTFSFCCGIISSLIVLGAISGLLGKIYGQLPAFLTTSISIFAIVMGLNLLGLIKFRLPDGPNFDFIKDKLPSFLSPYITGAAFGLASSPCITPVLATLLAWVSQANNPLVSILFLFFFGLGQVSPLIIVGLTTENLKQLLEFRKYSQIIPILSGFILITLGTVNIISKWL